MHPSVNAVSYIIRMLCEVGNKQSALRRKVKKVKNVPLLLCVVKLH